MGAMDDEVLAKARSQHGMLARAQALELGMTVVGYRCLTRHQGWEALVPGVVRLPGSADSWEQQLLMLHLWGGEHVVVSHRAAAARWGFEGFPPGVAEVTTTKDARRLPDSIEVHWGRPPTAQVTEVASMATTGRPRAS